MGLLYLYFIAKYIVCRWIKSNVERRKEEEIREERKIKRGKVNKNVMGKKNNEGRKKREREKYVTKGGDRK